jgi:hypothetical protein
VRGAHSGYQKERQARRRAEKEAEELKAKQQKASIENFQELTQEELEELSVDDRVEYELQKKDIAQMRTEMQDTEKARNLQAQLGEYSDFLFDELGIELEYGNDGRLTPESVKLMDENIPPAKVREIEQTLTEAFGEGTIYSAKQIKLAYNEVMRDEILLKERTRTRVAMKESTEAAARGQSRLDGLPSNPERRDTKVDVESLSTDDLVGMGESEFNALDEKWGK